MWKTYALLAAFFAGLTAVLAKCGVKGVNSNLATAIRTAVVLVLACGAAAATGAWDQCRELTRRNVIFLLLSGVATGLSWLFYFKALQLSEVSKVAPLDKLSVAFAVLLGALLLREHLSGMVILGTTLIVMGGLCILYGS